MVPDGTDASAEAGLGVNTKVLVKTPRSFFGDLVLLGIDSVAGHFLVKVLEMKA